MIILLSCLQDLRLHDIPAYRFWAKYFKEGIVEAGHEWMEIPNVDWAEACAGLSNVDLSAWKDHTWNRAIEYVRSLSATGRKIDLFLSYLYPQQIECGAIRDIQQLGIPCVNFFCDNVREFTRVPREFHGFDLHWVPEYEAIAMYQQAKLPYLSAPMPCWIAPELRTLPKQETEGPTFIGSSDTLRYELFSRVLGLGADLVLRGPGWSSDSSVRKESNRPKRSLMSTGRNQVDFFRAHGIKGFRHKVHDKIFPPGQLMISPAAIKPPVWGDEYFKVSREASVTVGVNRVPTFRATRRRPITYSRLRDIEAPMLGACYLTEYTKGVAQLYEIGREVETYNDAEELCSKLKELLAAPKHRASMRQRAQRRALAEHSVAKSLQKICDYLGLNRA
jgi:hypothetical protein